MPKGEGLARYNRKRAEEFAPAVYTALRDAVLATGATADCSVEEAHNYFVASIAESAGVKPMNAGLVFKLQPRDGVTLEREGRGAVIRVHPRAFLSSFDSAAREVAALPESAPLPDWAQEPAHDNALPLFKPKYPTIPVRAADDAPPAAE